MSGRTIWFPKDSAWWRRDRIVAVGLEFERAPAVLDWLTCEAKAQNPEQVSDGFVKTGYAALAHGATFGHATVDELRPVVSALVRWCLLDDFEEDGQTFTCRISGWREDIVLTLEAARKARKRDEKKVQDPEFGSSKPKDTAGQDRTSADVSGDVRKSPLQDKTRQSSLRSDNARGASKPFSYRGQRVPAATVADAEHLCAVVAEATGRACTPRTSGGDPTPALKQIVGALIAREDVTLETWEAAVRRTAANPPGWAEGRKLVIGDFFGERAAEHAIAAASTPPPGGEGAAEMAAFREHMKLRTARQTEDGEAA